MSNHRVMISSTIRDLPDHRKEVLDACLRQRMLPLMMEHLPASPYDAIHESLKLVDEATIYLGILGHRYGYIPSSHAISITEMEYERAGERGIPRLTFLMHEDHLVRVADVETGKAALQLKAFKERMLRDQVAAFFQSPMDLRAHVINSLSQFRQPDLKGFHFVSDIPDPPDPYVAHPYTLLHTHALVGRKSEIDLLTEWVARKDSEVFGASILVLVAIGGMGKSAVTWKWFQEIAPQEMSPLAGRLWWSFYESDATFENFVIRALAYVKGVSRAEAQALAVSEREEQLLNLLHQRPFLLVLDGLERLLIAYARMDAPSMGDDDLDEESGNAVVGALGTIDAAETAFKGRHRLRKTADPRAGNFLRKLSAVRATRVLVSTRLYPAELQTETGTEISGVKAVFLSGLTDDDALILWRSFGVSGSQAALQPLFSSFDNYPLLIRALAGEVAQHRSTPGDFQEWLRLHPEFEPLDLPLIQRKSHILSFALRGLGSDARKVLATLSAFRMPAAYDTLVSLLVGLERALQGEAQLDVQLADLEDRGLLGWDRRANRYDLHPIVRGITWHSLGRIGRRIIYENLQSHFESLPALGQDEAESLDDLTAAIELFNTLVGLENYDAAYELFRSHLMHPTLDRLSFCQQGAEWLEALFPKGIDQSPALTDPKRQAEATCCLARSHFYNGNLRLAANLYDRTRKAFDPGNAILWENIASTLKLRGALYDAEIALRRIISRGVAHRPETIGKIGNLLGTRTSDTRAEMLLCKALRLLKERPSDDEHEVYFCSSLVNFLIRAGNLDKALDVALSTQTLARRQQRERSVIVATNALGEALLAHGDSNGAIAQFSTALKKTRAISYVASEIDSLLGLARAWRVQGDLIRSRDVLDDCWEPIKRGEFRLHHGEALIILAENENMAGDRRAATISATDAYRVAWCDGPPFADYRTLEDAKTLLSRLGEDLPTDFPLLEATSRGPMIEIDYDFLLT